MLSYSANKQDNKLIDITKITTLMTATDKSDEFKLDKQGGYFYFTDGASKVLYKTIEQVQDGVIVKRNDDLSIVNAFSEAITLNLTEATIYPLETIEPPISPETQEEVKDLISEKIIIQPIIQPIQIQSDETIIPQFQTLTTDPQFKEKPSYAETWVWQNIAIPVQDKGVKVYNDNIPETEVRPREYVVTSVDDEVRDIHFAGNKNYGEESFITLIIQGHGNTFENWVVEISNFIHELLRGFREKGEVRDIVNRNIGYDEKTKILSRNISFWLQF